jgi:hypothetical protein
MALLLGYDVGSSSMKATLMEAETGRVLATVSVPDKELEIIAKKPVWAEQHPQTWWDNVVAATQKIKMQINFAIINSSKNAVKNGKKTGRNSRNNGNKKTSKRGGNKPHRRRNLSHLMAAILILLICIMLMLLFYDPISPPLRELQWKLFEVLSMICLAIVLERINF